jgi:lupus La protein
MSAEAEVTDALQKPVEQNAQSAEDVKQMLAELEGEAGAKNDTEVKVQPEEQSEAKSNGTAAGDKDSIAKEQTDDDKENVDQSPDRRRGDRGDRYDRQDRGGRDRGRGGRGRGGFVSRGGYRNNIKSDVTTQEESDDPVAIRRQVQHCHLPLLMPY